jgi:hypothetical protein
MHPYIQSTEKSTYGQIKNACARCGKTKEWHDVNEAILKAAHEIKEELSAEQVAKEWLVSKGFKNHPFYPSGLWLLKNFIEDQRSLLKE